MENNKTRTVVALIVMVAVVTLAVMFMLNVKGCQAKVSAETTATTSTETSAEPTSTTTADPDDEKKTPTEADATSIPVELLKKRFGEAPEFKSTSTLAEEGKRVEDTKIYDGVTYKVVPPDNLEGIIKEILSNPIYLSGVDLALREAKLVGQSDWSNKFHQSFDPLTTGWWEKWVEKRSDGKLYVTEAYYEIAMRYACIVEGMQYVKVVKDGQKAKVHFPLNVEMEVCYKSTNQEKYPFWIYKFQFKDGREVFIGINQVDYRWAIFPPVPTPTPTKKVTPTPTESKKVTPTPTETKTTPKQKKNDPVRRNKNKDAAADIGTPSNAENHNNSTAKTTEPVSPKKASAATPTPKPTVASTKKPAATQAPTKKATATPKPTPKVITGTAPKTDPDDK